jgi:hypothetical protein
MNDIELIVMICLMLAGTGLVLFAGAKSAGGDKQSRIESLIESIVNVSSGFIISLLLWTFFIMPVFNIDTSFAENLAITSTFTIISVARGFIWRRFFNAGLHRTIHKWVRR